MHPKLVKHLIFPLHEKIIGRKTFAYLDELERLQWASPSHLEKLQFEKLKALLIHAGKNIPFYGKRFSTAGFDPAKMQSVEDFKMLPFLTKDDIRQNLDDMTWRECPGGLHRYNTGGSSGQPLIFYFDQRRQAYDAAARALTHRWWEIDIGDKELYLWGSPLEITKQDRIKDVRDLLTNQLLLSAFELSPAQLHSYVKRIERFKPKCLFGYPSSIDLFCQMAKQHGYNLSNVGVQVVFSTAEVLYDHQKKNISEAFGGVPVVNGYGSREGGFISHECPQGAMHVIDPNIVIEYVRNGQRVGQGEDGEIVVTHLDAWGMPFIRYRTGDVAQPDDRPCTCGRHLTVMKKIQGRTTDFVVTPDGRWQHALSVIYIVRDIEGVVEFKIIQNNVDDVLVLLKVDNDSYPSNGNELIVSGLKKRMGKEVNVAIEIVDNIPRDASGKYRYVVSKVAQEQTLGASLHS
ncbi:MAG: phenylacetate--CoA ligase family protein [Deltaproteobacteria bacterium]|nr:phenylacetate--CoA ligase family protein [Deltaproteobacteria bacterium]